MIHVLTCNSCKIAVARQIALNMREFKELNIFKNGSRT